MRILFIIIAFFVAGILFGKLPTWLSDQKPNPQPDFMNRAVYLNQWPSDSLLKSLDAIPVQEWIDESAGPSFNDTNQKVSKIIPLSSTIKISSSSNPIQKPTTDPKILPELKKQIPSGTNAWLISWTSKLKQAKTNPGILQKIKSTPQETEIRLILKRLYGDQAKNIPQSLIDFDLQKLNPRVNFKSIPPGTILAIP